ncbi:unnamed protein product [Clonostachys rosea]|uniref:Zn(2)-C6 fungal-type domain-containing protein n=1 Tax=Bionectria ochroleuca TaxID=29856 RepID=A0ABY6UJL8_BIOOC|nr:unnamed protein product [Clonostachys rosea]
MTPETPSLRKTLRDRYEARRRKSCLPCRERKVRCNRQQPCLTCIKRGHVDLCSYPRSTQQKASDGSLGKNTTDDIASLPSSPEVGHQSQERNDKQQSPTRPSFLGAGSILILSGQNEVLHGQRSGRQEAFETGIFPLFGTQATGDSPVPPNDEVKLAFSSLPPDEEIMELFSHFKSRFYPFQPIFYDVDYIESVVSSLIGRKGQAPKVNAHFLCLFHALLAAGAQFSDRPAEQRSKLFHKHCKPLLLFTRPVSFRAYFPHTCLYYFPHTCIVRHALNHLGTFEVVLNPTIEIIQGLIVLSQVLQNDVNPRGAWILSGVTIRSALCLGIHKRGPRPESSQLSSKDADNLRWGPCLFCHYLLSVDSTDSFSRMAIVWQDTLLSMAFGRNPSSHEMYHEEDLPPLGQASGLTYRQAMNWICHALIKYFVVPASPPDLAVYNDILHTLSEIQASCANHIRERSECRSLLEVQEHYRFTLHRNFGISFICRPILSRQGRQNMAPKDASDILSQVLDALKQSATAFASLRSISNYSTRSWACLHNGLCSALMLGFIEQTKGLEETKNIQTQLIASLEASQELQGGSLSNAYQKALCALKAQRKLAEESDMSRATAIGQGVPEKISALSPLTENPQFQQNMLDPSDLSSFDMDEWVRSVDFGSYSPLEAYDFIMSDQFAPGSLF